MKQPFDKALAIRHSKSFQLKDKLKALGCRWNPNARAWIAPNQQVYNDCMTLLEKAESNVDSYNTPHFGKCGFQDIDFEQAEALLAQSNQLKQIHTANKEYHTLPIIYYKPTKYDAESICNTGNIKRYWHQDITTEAEHILALGHYDEQAIYLRLEDKGWKPRQVSLLLDIVKYIRTHASDYL